MWEGHNRTPVALINLISKPIIIIILIEPLCNYAYLFWAKNKVTTPGLTVKTSLFSWVVVSFFPLINNQSKPRSSANILLPKVRLSYVSWLCGAFTPSTFRFGILLNRNPVARLLLMATTGHYLLTHRLAGGKRGLCYDVIIWPPHKIYWNILMISP